LALATFAALNLVSVPIAFAGCGEPTSHHNSSPVFQPAAFALEGNDTPGEPIVGLWRTTVTNPQLGVIQRGFDAFHSDHTEILNEFHDPRTGNVCLGVWTQAGARTYKLLHPAFWWDANGNWIGYRVLRATVTVDQDGDHFSGPWLVTRVDLNGNALSYVEGTLTGERIKVDDF
jgi:hypothetical protein